MRYESAELAKTAINLFLAAQVCTANTLAEICEKIGADWQEIIPSLRLDKRIGQHAYIEPGLGLSGGNIDLFTLSNVMQRGLVEQGRLVRLDVAVTDRPGGLLAIVEILAREKANVLQVFHQRESLRRPLGETLLEFLLETRGEDHTQKLLTTLKEKGYSVQRGA